MSRILIALVEREQQGKQTDAGLSSDKWDVNNEQLCPEGRLEQTFPQNDRVSSASCQNLSQSRATTGDLIYY